MTPRISIPQLLTVLPLFILCGDFSTSFEEITQDRVRTIDFIYRNCADTALCEAAPGDSMEVIALFAGEKVHDIRISASFDVRTSLYGKIESFGSAPLDYSIRRSTVDVSGAADGDTFAFTFKVPESLLSTSTFLPEQNWISTLPSELQPLIPPAISSLCKSDAVALLQAALEADSAGTQGGTADSLRHRFLGQFPGGIETLLQLFSAQIELTAIVNQTYTTVSYATVRLNRHVSRIDSTVVANRNPLITRMGIYRVLRNNLTFFDPAIHTQPYETMVLYDRALAVSKADDTLLIRKNESYFLFVESDSPQLTRSISGAILPEDHQYEWFFRQYADDTASVRDADRMSIVNGSDGPTVPLITAATEHIRRSRIWVQVRDESTGSRLYPTGSAVFSTGIFFSYDPDYLKQ